VSESPLTPSADRIAPMLAAIWQRSQAQIGERLALLDCAACALASGTLSCELREEAHSTAHKLAGLLGTFGFPEGTDLAREIEADFASEDGGSNRLGSRVEVLRKLLFPG
jgi:HPt (histidine-containing phosphotransfer) domain-containing protein